MFHLHLKVLNVYLIKSFYLILWFNASTTTIHLLIHACSPKLKMNRSLPQPLTHCNATVPHAQQNICLRLVTERFKIYGMFQNAAEVNVRSIRAYVTELKERVAKLQYQKQLLVCQVLEMEANEAAGYNMEIDETIIETEEPEVASNITFREQRQQIIKLWDVCFVSIIHRTQFYLLFKGDPADQIYMEVELRRLTWLQQHLSELGNVSPLPVAGGETTISLSSRQDVKVALPKQKTVEDKLRAEAQKIGFPLEWPELDECERCQNRSGRCGYNGSLKKVVFICNIAGNLSWRSI